MPLTLRAQPQPLQPPADALTLVIVGLALLIATAVTDQGSDNQAFSAHDAWKYVTWLSIAYIISRGLTKFAGHERGDWSDDHDHDHL
jgi:hypothetical protein